MQIMKNCGNITEMINERENKMHVLLFFKLQLCKNYICLRTRRIYQKNVNT